MLIDMEICSFLTYETCAPFRDVILEINITINRLISKGTITEHFTQLYTSVFRSILRFVIAENSLIIYYSIRLFIIESCTEYVHCRR